MTFDRILVATDFSDQAHKAADWAVAVAAPLHARITLAHVYDLPIVGFPDAALLVDAQTAARMSDEAQAALDAELARLRSSGAEVEGVLRQGDVRDVIPTLAGSLGAGLIVVGSHGRRGLVRALLGSVAESLVRTATTPVVVLRSEA